MEELERDRSVDRRVENRIFVVVVKGSAAEYRRLRKHRQVEFSFAHQTFWVSRIPHRFPNHSFRQGTLQSFRDGRATRAAVDIFPGNSGILAQRCGRRASRAKVTGVEGARGGFIFGEREWSRHRPIERARCRDFCRRVGVSQNSLGLCSLEHRNCHWLLDSRRAAAARCLCFKNDHKNVPPQGHVNRRKEAAVG